MKFGLKPLSAIVLMFAFSNALATSYVVYDTTISTYIQSTTGSSTAHLIRSDKPIYNGTAHPWCGDRAYIDMQDSALISAAIAASTSGQSVNFIYEDADQERTAQGHLTTRCKVVSIFR